MATSSERATPVIEIRLAAPPFRPWLRLAHVWTFDGTYPHLHHRRLADHEFILQVEGDNYLDLPGYGLVHQPQGSLTLMPPGLLHGHASQAGTHIAVHADLMAQPELIHPAMLLHERGEQPISTKWMPPPLVNWRCGDTVWSTPLVQTIDLGVWRQRFAPLIAMWNLRTLDRPRERLVATTLLAESFSTWFDSDSTHGLGDGDLDRLLLELDVRDRRLRIMHLAQRLGMGEAAFRAAVRRRTGCTPAAWLESKRMELASQLLLSSGLGVTAVAAAVGYDDAFHFSRVFRRHTGFSPRNWRERSLRHVLQP